MNWLSEWYDKHPEYRRLRSRKTPNSIHFEIAPRTYEAHFWIGKRFEHTALGLWLPFSQLTDSLRIAQRLIRSPRALAAFAAMLPFGTVFTDGPSGTVTTSANTIAAAGTPTWNYGARIYLIYNSVGDKGLLRFNCSSIPSNAICSAVTLRVTKPIAVGDANYTGTVYSIAVGNKTWIPGTTNGALAAAGEPCWNALAANGSGGVTTAWAGSAGLSTSVVDYEASALGSYSGHGSDGAGTQYTVTLTASRIAGWFGVVNTNYGLLIYGGGANLGTLASSNHATVAYRPLLTVTYTLPTGGGVFNPPFSSAFRGPFG